MILALHSLTISQTGNTALSKGQCVQRFCIGQRHCDDPDRDVFFRQPSFEAHRNGEGLAYEPFNNLGGARVNSNLFNRSVHHHHLRGRFCWRVAGLSATWIVFALVSKGFHHRKLQSQFFAIVVSGDLWDDYSAVDWNTGGLCVEPLQTSR